MDGDGTTKAANAKAKWQNLMKEAGQSSPSPLTGISQSEGAALETWNRLNKMKWKKQMDWRKKKCGKCEMWGEKGKWKMQRKHNECWELQEIIR